MDLRYHLGMTLDCTKIVLGATLFIALACDEEQTGKTAAPAASGTPAASAEVPTPEKIAGIEFGSVKLCVVPKAGAAPAEVSVKVAPIFNDGDPKEGKPSEKTFALKKAEKGYCDFVHPDFSRLWGNILMVTATDVPLDEVGIYYLKDWKENPTGEALTYAKLVKTNDETFKVNVLIANAVVPTIQVQVKE